VEDRGQGSRLGCTALERVRLGQSLPNNLELFLDTSWLTVTYHRDTVVKTSLLN